MFKMEQSSSTCATSTTRPAGPYRASASAIPDTATSSGDSIHVDDFATPKYYGSRMSLMRDELLPETPKLFCLNLLLDQHYFNRQLIWEEPPKERVI